MAEHGHNLNAVILSGAGGEDPAPIVDGAAAHHGQKLELSSRASARLSSPTRFGSGGRESRDLHFHHREARGAGFRNADPSTSRSPDPASRVGKPTRALRSG